MKLDFDCVRDILICVEEHTGLRQNCYFVDVNLMNEMLQYLGPIEPTPVQPYQQVLIEKYGNDTLYYHVQQCGENALMTRVMHMPVYQFMTTGLSLEGSRVLARIRTDDRWAKAKAVLDEIPVASIVDLCATILSHV